MMRGTMLERAVGNLLEADVDALVNTVNTVGVMGKGIALQFKRAFPDNFAAYARACRAGEVEVGRMLVVERLASPRYIINFPTKKHWSRPSQLSYVKDGLVDLVDQVTRRGIRSIAIPPLGAGNGGLPWEQVRPIIEEAFVPLEGVRVLLYEPRSAPSPESMPDRTAKPRMTPGRAAILALMHRYRATGYDYRLSLIEVQKLAYFLQTEGEPLKLDFRPHLYGPYADALRKVLRHIEGHYTQGVGDGKNSPTTEISLLPGAEEEAEAFLRSREDTSARLQRVASIIEGFESPFGMELLATVHWVREQEGARTFDEAVQRVAGWSGRKRSLMKPGHIRAAWERLEEVGREADAS